MSYYLYRTSIKESQELVHKHYFSQEKSFSKLKLGDTIVVAHRKARTWISEGEITLSDFIHILPENSFCSVPFIEYYARNIKHDEEALKAIDKAKLALMPNYKIGTQFMFLFCQEAIDYIIKTGGEWPPIEIQNQKEYKRSGEYLSEVDKWLKSMGLLNDEGYENSDVYIFKAICYEKQINVPNNLPLIKKGTK